MRWKWMIWQVIAPLGAPILISALVVFLWWTGASNFSIKWHSLFDDVTPWALIFYSITLIGATMNDFWSKLPEHPVLGVGLIALGFVVALYSALIVLWRQLDSHFIPGTAVNLVTFLLLALSIGLCYTGAKRAGR